MMERQFVPMWAHYIARMNVEELSEMNNQFIERSLEIQKQYPQKTSWNCKTYNSLEVYDIANDPLMSQIVEVAKREVKDLCPMYGTYPKEIELKESWINISETNQGQEFHIHPNSHFSVVYYINAPKDCGNLVLKNAFGWTDMHPLPSSEINFCNSDNYWVEPLSGEMVIFRSNVPHMVKDNESDQLRITAAMNFEVIT
jgi:uncharacterized protein (TIGR02466 family)